MRKSYHDMTLAEIKKAATPTPKEQAAIDAFIAAAKALPNSICIDVMEDDYPNPNLTVSKRISRGTAQQVASLRKASLVF